MSALANTAPLFLQQSYAQTCSAWLLRKVAVHIFTVHALSQPCTNFHPHDVHSEGGGKGGGSRL